MLTRWAGLALAATALLVVPLTGADPAPEESSKKAAAKATDDDPLGAMADPFDTMGSAKPTNRPVKKALDDDPSGSFGKERVIERVMNQRPLRRDRESPLLSSSPPTEAIRLALDKPVHFDFAIRSGETPFCHVVDLLRNKLDLPIVLDWTELEDVGVGPRTPVTLDIDGMSARSVLNLTLSDLDLAWTVSNEVVLITSLKRAALIQETVVYDVHDLRAARDEEGRLVNDFDPIIDTITSTIAPMSWDQVGGPGSIARFEAGGISAICVLQTRQVHEAVEKLLADLRKAAHGKPVADATRAHANAAGLH